MRLNIALNSMLGLTPVFGDLWSMGFQGNVKNVELLKHHTIGDRHAFTTGFLILVIGLLLVTLYVILGTVARIISVLMQVQVTSKAYNADMRILAAASIMGITRKQ